jgi:hypothetical protein
MIKKIPLPCPVCGRRLIDVRSDICFKTYKIEAQAMIKDAEVFQKCWNCKHEIGIQKIS